MPVIKIDSVQAKIHQSGIQAPGDVYKVNYYEPQLTHAHDSRWAGYQQVVVKTEYFEGTHESTGEKALRELRKHIRQTGYKWNKDKGNKDRQDRHAVVYQIPREMMNMEVQIAMLEEGVENFIQSNEARRVV